MNRGGEEADSSLTTPEREIILTAQQAGVTVEDPSITGRNLEAAKKEYLGEVLKSKSKAICTLYEYVGFGCRVVLLQPIVNILNRARDRSFQRRGCCCHHCGDLLQLGHQRLALGAVTLKDLPPSCAPWTLLG